MSSLIPQVCTLSLLVPLVSPLRPDHRLAIGMPAWTIPHPLPQMYVIVGNGDKHLRDDVHLMQSLRVGFRGFFRSNVLELHACAWKAVGVGQRG